MLAIVNLHNETFACIPELPAVTGGRNVLRCPAQKAKKEKKSRFPANHYEKPHSHDKNDGWSIEF